MGICISDTKQTVSKKLNCKQRSFNCKLKSFPPERGSKNPNKWSRAPRCGSGARPFGGSPTPPNATAFCQAPDLPSPSPSLVLPRNRLFFLVRGPRAVQGGGGGGPSKRQLGLDQHLGILETRSWRSSRPTAPAASSLWWCCSAPRSCCCHPCRCRCCWRSWWCRRAGWLKKHGRHSGKTFCPWATLLAGVLAKGCSLHIGFFCQGDSFHRTIRIGGGEFYTVEKVHITT